MRYPRRDSNSQSPGSKPGALIHWAKWAKVLPGGLEPRIAGLKGRSPGQLDDGSNLVISGGFEPRIPAVRVLCPTGLDDEIVSCAPGGIRTPNLSDRSRLL